LVNADGLIWLGRRAGLEAEPDAGAWQMPQGGIDDGESADVAVLRELQEEIGTAHGTIIARIGDWLSYDFPDFVPKKTREKWRGQRQKWFLLRFTGQNSDVDVRGVAHPEFSAWRWATSAEAIALVVPFKRDIYEEVLDQFSQYLR
jgi:putative (di)nucleoside polyphosphate hydrolase